MSQLAAEEQELTGKLVNIRRERKRRANQADGDDPQVSEVPLKKLCGNSSYAGMGEQILMERLEGLNSKDYGLRVNTRSCTMLKPKWPSVA